jgi:hypothetical protein
LGNAFMQAKSLDIDHQIMRLALEIVGRRFSVSISASRRTP